MKITRAVIGSGILSEGESVATLTAKSEIPSHQTGTTSSTATVDIVNVDVISAGTVNIRIRIKNGDTVSICMKIGIMAEDPDEGEILYICIQDVMIMHRVFQNLREQIMFTELLIF